MSENTNPTESKAGPPWKKIALLVLVVGVAAAAYFQFRDVLTLEYLASKEASIRAYKDEHPFLVYGIAFALYVLVTALSLPGALILTLVCGWLFGFWHGLILVSFASTLGATLAMLMSRYFLGEWVQKKYGEKLAGFNAALEKEGAFYLFSLRLIPAAPFFVINLLMGLTKIKATTFWWVSQVGMLAGTAVFIYAASQFPSLAELKENGAGGILSPQLIVAFILLGTFPIIVKKLMGKFRPPVAS